MSRTKLPKFVFLMRTSRTSSKARLMPMQTRRGSPETRRRIASGPPAISSVNRDALGKLPTIGAADASHENEERDRRAKRGIHSFEQRQCPDQEAGRQR